MGSASVRANSSISPPLPVKGIRWAEEERVLVLDLYLRAGSLSKSDPRVEELCRILDALPIHPTRSVSDRIRSADTVVLKLKNFAWLDPDENGGLQNAAKGDIDVWNRYASDRDALDTAVAAIKKDGRLPARLPGESRGSD